MPIPALSRANIRRNTNTQSFSRAEEYYRPKAVTDLIQRGNLIQADVEGSELRAYRISIQFDQAGITSAHCTCPYDYDGWCKHIVATLLTCLEQPNSIEERPPLAELLKHLDFVQTQQLIQELVTEQPDLIDAIDRYISLISAPKPQKQSGKTKVKRRTTIDGAPFSRQVRQILRDALRELEDGTEDDPITDDILEVIAKAEAFSEQGDGNNAIAILEAITSTCAHEWDNLENYGADYDSIGEHLDQAWTEASNSKFKK